jgi:FkbM family methyltransferase
MVKLFIKKALGYAPKIKKGVNIPVEKHGDNYGSWVISKNSLTKDSAVFSVGIGNDIAFDLSIIKQYNATMYEFDPTPEVGVWLNKQTLPANFKYFPFALAASDSDVKFYKPAVEGHISHSIGSTNEQQPYVTVQARKLSSLMQNFKMTHLDLLKMDIEGFEYEVIDDIIASDCVVNQLLIEFHHGLYGKKVADTEGAIKKLLTKGYQIFHISESGREVSFIKN